MNSPNEFPNPKIGIPEDSEAFKEWQRRRDAGEFDEAPETTDDPDQPHFKVPDVRIGIPEDSEAFKEWERNRRSQDQADL